jgi:hypothetical protein
MHARAVHAQGHAPRAVQASPYPGRHGGDDGVASAEADAVRALARWQAARIQAGLMRPGPPRLFMPMHTAS